ncbi:hypothetical protein DFP73DRAFT_13772 [Morchella snyderi]|nr:hypothetical protein DFP73DRAFT_13772 [Morchella snyderi]
MPSRVHKRLYLTRLLLCFRQPILSSIVRQERKICTTMRPTGFVSQCASANTLLSLCDTEHTAGNSRRSAAILYNIIGVFTIQRRRY